MKLDSKLNKRELTFLMIGILMLIIAVLTIILSIKFLISSLNQALEKDNSGNGDLILKFQIEKAESLKK